LLIKYLKNVNIIVNNEKENILKVQSSQNIALKGCYNNVAFNVLRRLGLIQLFYQPIISLCLFFQHELLNKPTRKILNDNVVPTLFNYNENKNSRKEKQIVVRNDELFAKQQQKQLPSEDAFGDYERRQNFEYAMNCSKNNQNDLILFHKWLVLYYSLYPVLVWCTLLQFKFKFSPLYLVLREKVRFHNPDQQNEAAPSAKKKNKNLKIMRQYEAPGWEKKNSI